MSRLFKFAAGFALVPLLALTAAAPEASARDSSDRNIGALASLVLEPRTNFEMQPDGSVRVVPGMTAVLVSLVAVAVAGCSPFSSSSSAAAPAGQPASPAASTAAAAPAVSSSPTSSSGGVQNLDATTTIFPFFNPNTVYFTIGGGTYGTPVNGIYLATISVTVVVLILLTILLRFTALGLRRPFEGEAPMTINGVHLNEYGNELVAQSAGKPFVPASVAKIVLGWPTRVQADRAARLGLTPDPDIDSIINRYIAEQ